jgi:hypothetical protein
MPTAWYGLRTDHLHNEGCHGGAVPETALEPTLEQGGGGGWAPHEDRPGTARGLPERGRLFGRPDSESLQTALPHDKPLSTHH